MRHFFVGVIMAVLVIGNATPAFAVTALDQSANILNQAAGNATANNPNGAGLAQDLTGLIGGIVKGVLGLAGTIFLVLTIYAGILWMTASGKEDQVESAKKILSAAVIGIAITMAAYTITYFITTKLRTVGGGAEGLKTPEKAVVCGQESGVIKGTCRTGPDCGSVKGDAIVGSTCGQDATIMCCSK